MSECVIGILDSVPALTLGPEIIKGTLIPPSIASHLPLLKGKLDPL